MAEKKDNQKLDDQSSLHGAVCEIVPMGAAVYDEERKDGDKIHEKFILEALPNVVYCSKIRHNILSHSRLKR